MRFELDELIDELDIPLEDDLTSILEFDFDFDEFLELIFSDIDMDFITSEEIAEEWLLAILLGLCFWSCTGWIDDFSIDNESVKFLFPFDYLRLIIISSSVEFVLLSELIICDPVCTISVFPNFL